MRLTSEVTRLLREKGIKDILVVLGGTIPRQDIPELKRMGVSEVFSPGTPLDAIVGYIGDNAGARIESG